MNDLTVAELGYLAGIIDGEGCVTLDSRAHPLLLVSNTSEDLILWLRDHVAQGTVQVKASHWSAAHRQQWTWIVTGRKVGGILEAVMPYLVIKRAQAALVLSVCTKGHPAEIHAFRNRAVKQIRVLNQRGERKVS